MWSAPPRLFVGPPQPQHLGERVAALRVAADLAAILGGALAERDEADIAEVQQPAEDTGELRALVEEIPTASSALAVPIHSALSSTPLIVSRPDWER